ncbi:type VI secretion system lipoprotein TssJ [Acerihabitans arboris]|uniref:Type VI secretion system lipoprotein TssJ n=1 Tax=Acerihabitans arboris TaxID=2691583 RepID=A0A845SSZ7_9GAMM|nr:type VI secretion system lipoprotein TssJ [Acerihabitans arboris]NDL64195.1 type VI secretion system lipoprotein TssJ [Acerihabitans arboris]
MAIIAGKYRSALPALFLTTTLAGCGLTQKVTDGTAAVAKAIFYQQVKTLHLDISAREAVNNNDGGAALSTVVRIYQLKDRKTLDSSDYPSLFANDSQALKSDLVAQKDIRVRPGESVAVDMPMEESAQFVAVAAMFLAPDTANNSWRVVLAREDLTPDTPRRIELNAQVLTLLPEKD